MGKVVSVILAGGKGKRMGAEVSKQFIEINGKPIIYYTLKAFEECKGGKERQDSVYNALNSIGDCDIVLIHDGARAFVSNKIIEDGIKYSREFGAAAPGVMPKDTIKVKNLEGFSVDTPNRASLVAVQTPQCFKYNLIKKGHNKVKNEKIQVTDDTMIVELLGEKVYLFEGDYKNIKVTTPEDLILAEHFVK